jgi:endonuclease/exonuclease/phosphatase (EEP) superfamily protein YafD
LQKGRQEAKQALAALRAVVPGFEHAKLRNFSMTLGVRDSRKIDGRYDLTEQDVTGQAAGTAAAVSLRDGTSTRTVDISAVQEKLRRQGVRIA